MTVNDLWELYEYDAWANRKLFSVMSKLTIDQFTKPVVGSNTSIRTTMIHAISAEWGWLSRCGGAERGERLSPEDFPTIESVIQLFNRVEGYVRDFLARLRDEDLMHDASFNLGTEQARSMPVGQLLQHSIYHSVHHRGQIAMLMRSLGYSAGNFDLLLYYIDKNTNLAW